MDERNGIGRVDFIVRRSKMRRSDREADTKVGSKRKW